MITRTRAHFVLIAAAFVLFIAASAIAVLRTQPHPQRIRIAVSACLD